MQTTTSERRALITLSYQRATVRPTEAGYGTDWHGQLAPSAIASAYSRLAQA